MRNTIRIVLALFLIVLVFANYNSIRIVNRAASVLNEDLQQRANLIVREIIIKLNEEFPNLKSRSELDENLRRWLRLYDVQGIVIYTASDSPDALMMFNLPQNLADPLKLLGNRKSAIVDKYLLVSGQFVNGAELRKVVLLFDIERYVRFERSAKAISYSGLLLIILAGIAVLYFFESAFRPFRVLLQTARSAPAQLPERENRNEADFLIQTFNSVIGQLKTKEQELARLHLSEKARADDVARLNQDLIRSISSGLILVDQNGRINVFNEAAESIFKISSKDVLSRSYREVLQNLSPAFKADVDRCLNERTNINRVELEIHTQNAELRYLGASIMPLQDREQKFAGVICIFTDITEFKMLQKHMAEKEKYASLGEMAGGVAHEFRNSVATISGYLQLLENKVDPEQQQYTGPVQKELQSLQKVVNDFLSFARPVELEMAPVSLRELLQECMEEVKVAASDNLDFELDGVFPEVRGDERMLRQVFTNLIRNAAESVEGTNRKGKLQINGSTALNGRFCVVDVADNGVGIKNEDLARIFAPFFSTKPEGVGLGLAIVQKLVLQHNGTITVETGSEGSVFRVQLPVN
ncbi:MAG TPA: ATP-binding protein [Acidobacteriota bacterium]|nr:ATP-binding protein [Acidobacteriota bacterium]